MPPSREQPTGIEPDDRHDRTRRFLGARGLARVQRSHVLIVGAGAVGNEVAKNLALVGVGRLTLVDPDVVELSNLNRCIFFRQADVGKKKVHVVRRELRRAAPETQVSTHARGIQDAPDDVWQADAVALCVDNELARFYVNARLLGGRRRIPVVNGAMASTWVEASVLIPGRTACLVCLWSQDYLESVLREDVARKCDDFFQETRVKFPTISCLTALVGAISSTEVVKLLAGASGGMHPAIGQRIRYDVRRHDLSAQDIVPNPACVDAVCRKHRKGRAAR